jgi:hypothetical protein
MRQATALLVPSPGFFPGIWNHHFRPWALPNLQFEGHTKQSYKALVDNNLAMFQTCLKTAGSARRRPRLIAKKALKRCFFSGRDLWLTVVPKHLDGKRALSATPRKGLAKHASARSAICRRAARSPGTTARMILDFG